MYNKYANSYSFDFKTKKFVLNPLQIFEFGLSPKPKKVAPMLTRQQISKALKAEQMVLLVVSHEAKLDDENIPLEL